MQFEFCRRPRLHLYMATLLAMALPAVCLADVTLYIAPNGSDAWSGRIAAPNAQKSDGPLATPTKARDLARAARNQDANQPITIQLRGGTYFLSEPLVLTSEDSGSEKSPITWSAYQNEVPILSAGRRVGAWEKTMINGHDAWVSHLAGAGKESFFFRELWIDGHRATRARWPKSGTLAVAAMPKAKTHPEWGTTVSEFYFNPGDLKAWPDLDQAEVVVMSRWVESRLPITAIDLSDNHLHFGKPAGFSPETADRYYIENLKECVTDPGDWCFDAKENAVYLIPPIGVASPNDAQVIVPVLPQIMRLIGDAQRKHFIEHLHFRGLSFAYSEWYYDHLTPGEKPDAMRTSYNQAAIGVPGAIHAEGLRNCTFDHCAIAHVGGYGLQLGRACQHNLISHCTLTDLGAGGIKIGEEQIRDDADDQASSNEVSDSQITDGGNVFPSAVGVWIGQSHDNALSHNEIARFWYTGISVGWTWGYGNAISQNNHVEDNEIHHIGIKTDADQPILSDMGGIYTLGNEHGTIIRHNSFHDISAIKYGGWGIYFDEGTTDILAENNLVYRTTHGGFHQHYGKDNTVRNNIFAFGRDAQIQRTRLEDHRSFSFEKNIVDWNTGVLLTGDWGKLNVDFDRNTYWHSGADFKFDKLSWEQWRDQGMDKNSRIADPHFENAGKGDFHLTNKAEKALAGFVPFDLTGFGPRQ